MLEESSTLLAEGRCAQDGESVKQLPCRHAYHAPCIDQWLVVSKVMTVASLLVASWPELTSCSASSICLRVCF